MISNRTFAAILALILVLSLAAAAFFWFNRGSGTQVLVTVNGQPYGAYPLNKNQRIVIGPEDGSWYNVLEIKNGKAAIVESNCSNQICVHTPALTEDFLGVIVCLPHGLVAELSS